MSRYILRSDAFSGVRLRVAPNRARSYAGLASSTWASAHKRSVWLTGLSRRGRGLQLRLGLRVGIAGDQHERHALRAQRGRHRRHPLALADRRPASRHPAAARSSRAAPARPSGAGPSTTQPASAQHGLDLHRQQEDRPRRSGRDSPAHLVGAFMRHPPDPLRPPSGVRSTGKTSSQDKPSGA